MSRPKSERGAVHHVHRLIPQDVYAALRCNAVLEERSVTGQVMWMLKQECQMQGPEEESDDKE